MQILSLFCVDAFLLGNLVYVAMHILLLFSVDAPLLINSGIHGNADFVAMLRRCASFG